MPMAEARFGVTVTECGFLSPSEVVMCQLSPMVLPILPIPALLCLLQFSSQFLPQAVFFVLFCLFRPVSLFERELCEGKDFSVPLTAQDRLPGPVLGLSQALGECLPSE